MITPTITIIASIFSTSTINYWNSIIDLLASKSAILSIGLIAVIASMAYTIYKQVRLMNRKE